MEKISELKRLKNLRIMVVLITTGLHGIVLKCHGKKLEKL